MSAWYFGMKGHVENVAEWHTKETSLSKTKQISMESTEINEKYTINVPPRKHVTLMLYWFNVDIDLPFTASIHVQAIADRALVGGGSRRANVDPSAIKSFLMNEDYNIQNIRAYDENSVIAEILGSIKVKGATGYIIEHHEEDLPSDQICDK